MKPIRGLREITLFTNHPEGVIIKTEVFSENADSCEYTITNNDLFTLQIREESFEESRYTETQCPQTHHASSQVGRPPENTSAAYEDRVNTDGTPPRPREKGGVHSGARRVTDRPP